MRYIALDIGNVLIPINFDSFLNKLSRELNIARSDAFYFLSRTQKLHDLGITSLVDELRDHFKLRSEPIIEEIVQEWSDIIYFDNKVLDHINFLLSDPDIKVALLSNMGLEHSKVLFNGPQTKRWANIFGKSIKFLSCDVGARKPNKLFFQSFLMDYPEFRGCVYVDDLQNNLNTATNYGFEAIPFDLNDYSVAKNLKKDFKESEFKASWFKIKSFIGEEK